MHPPLNQGFLADVINVSGHRLSTAEIESALILHPGVSETAIIGSADELTGQAVFAFVTLKPCVALRPFHHTLAYREISAVNFQYGPNHDLSLVKELTLQVRKMIGPFAALKKVYIVSDLPKTRSGKIMRRIMRKIVAGEGDQLGDLSTLAEPVVVETIKAKVAASV
ncbi:acetyl-CoA synthetase-like protein [Auriscalpium vulgare]|uniref:Acetyl-CoA synthetase-like protein n=1 Tax=Auriscalpium vulgare TaxID=40419 RepID=A0ACB8R9C1_9AGAM|nr:acetyl-CoA synthetase-like protein [Auriscalpium vulgare]